MNKINFGKIGAPIDPPLLLKMQKDSFAEFLQKDTVPEKRKLHGLEGAFRDIFPLTNSDESLVLEYVSYAFGEPKYSVEESIARDATYALPLKVKLRLMHRKEDGKEKELSEQEVYFGDIPLMTDTATFIINGAERVVVSQIHRSPGVIFEEDEEKRVTVLGKPLYFARMIPYRGAWVEFEFDQNGILYVRIDRKRKIYATTLLRSLGFESDEEILSLFKESKEISLDTPSAVLANEYLAEDIYDKATGEVIADAGKDLREELVKKLQAKGLTTVAVLKDASILLTLKKDSIKTQKEAVNHIYKVLKTQEFIMQERAQGFLEELLFKSVRRYDLTMVGRYKILKKLAPIYEYYAKNFKLPVPSESKRTLTREDIVATLKYLIALYNGEADFTEGKQTIKIGLDDIDHLGNRRVRSVGELLENQIRIGLVQMARLVKEHMNNQDKSNVTPRSLTNITQFVAQIRKFFGTSQLSQFMDQINPLAELTHKRRLSALGPGGLNRKRAGFEVRDVHHTHYGRVCPIETPEGPNIGLITSLATFARVNPYGLIETPFKKIEDGKSTDKIEYLTADKEDEFFVAQANTPLDEKGRIASDSVHGRRWDSFIFQPPAKVDYMDISPMQVISVSAGLIPFLEHDDANRALMGCNMQRQGVPLLCAEAPLVSTGIEEKVARDSGVVIVAKSEGEVASVSADEIMINSKNGEIEVYNLRKYARSNQDTCIDQKPLVKLGDSVKKGQIIADGPATKDGQLALGQNLLIAYMPWDGYNFEDAMLLSEKLIQSDKFTSVHIREFQTEARETKGRPEEITKDIPNVGSEDLLNLDEDGVIKVGSYVQRGDILVGKTAPKGEQQTTPEERLLRVLFGKKAEDVQDASLRVPPGVSGKVIGVRTFVRLEKLTDKERKKKQDEMRDAYDAAKSKLRKDKKELLAGAKKSESAKIEALYLSKEEILKKNYEAEKERFKKGDELPVSVNKIVKVYIAAKLKVQVGDKLAGRHGNKGIVARILPVEDMPRLPDGTPVDCVLSPLAIPSRMNVGQLLEIMLGWAGKELNTQMITPVFDGASEEQIKDYVGKAKTKLTDLKKKELVSRGLKGRELEEAISKFEKESLPTNDCKVTLYDGRTGEPFMEKVTIGVMYIMKLNHLVEDKMHARSTGPYSLITRQPLGGKAQFGGQRFGEMEVWAIEGYGAAHILQEFLTVKSDDVDGRVKMYDSIIRGESISEPGIPESFKVLVSELKALGLNVELLNEKGGADKQEKTKSDGGK
ncbi:MAG: DNA-directed RNA polymerase subunit beta [Endomicrobia bacterium]|nr:DNA-directed RNA polymerase subunit beta [Endomicrobiia bacterium]MCL2507407.1 DNA-directed RNA polymerase subunit beta [Endomicrobiia bacterium]